LAGFAASFLPKKKERVLWWTFIPIGVFSAALLLYFAWIFRDGGRKHPDGDYLLDIWFFIIPISFSYISLSVAAVRLMFGKLLHNGSDEENKGSDLPNKPQSGQKESRARWVTAASKRTYIVASVSACIFIASTTILLGRVSGAFHLLSDVPDWPAVVTAIASAIGVIYPIIIELGKIKEPQEAAQKYEDKIAQLERDLEAARDKPVPTDSENHK
jgi:hypothetical protein